MILVGLLYFVLKNIRSDYFPFIILAAIQNRNFKEITDLKEIKNILKLSDKGHLLEELFATPAWSPILSIESTNGETWKLLKKNLLSFMEHIPSNEKLLKISESEKDYILSNKIFLDAKVVCTSTLKVFLKWLFCENHLGLKGEEKNHDINKSDIDEFSFINKFLTEEFIDKMYESC